MGELFESMFNGPVHFAIGVLVILVIAMGLTLVYLICRWLWRAGSKPQ